MFDTNKASADAVFDWRNIGLHNFIVLHIPSFFRYSPYKHVSPYELISSGMEICPGVSEMKNPFFWLQVNETSDKAVECVALPFLEFTGSINFVFQL